MEYAKAAVRAFVEHPFHLVKNLFGHRKTRLPARELRLRQPAALPRAPTSSSRCDDGVILRPTRSRFSPVSTSSIVSVVSSAS